MLEPQSTALFILLMVVFCALVCWMALARQMVLRDRRLDQQTEVIPGVLEEDCARVLREFFAGRRHPDG